MYFLNLGVKGLTVRDAPRFFPRARIDAIRHCSLCVDAIGRLPALLTDRSCWRADCYLWPLQSLGK